MKLLILSILLNSCYNKITNEEKQYAAHILNEFLKDTSNSQLLKTCDSIYMVMYLKDTNDRFVLSGLKITKAYLDQFSFVMEINSRLFTDSLLYMRHFENSKIYEYTKDSFNYRKELQKTEKLLEDTDFNNLGNYSKLIIYIKVLNNLYGRKKIDLFVSNKLTNEKLYGDLYNVDSLVNSITR